MSPPALLVNSFCNASVFDGQDSCVSAARGCRALRASRDAARSVNVLRRSSRSTPSTGIFRSRARSARRLSVFGRGADGRGRRDLDVFRHRYTIGRPDGSARQSAVRRLEVFDGIELAGSSRSEYTAIVVRMPIMKLIATVNGSGVSARVRRASSHWKTTSIPGLAHSATRRTSQFVIRTQPCDCT